MLPLNYLEIDLNIFCTLVFLVNNIHAQCNLVQQILYVSWFHLIYFFHIFLFLHILELHTLPKFPSHLHNSLLIKIPFHHPLLWFHHLIQHLILLQQHPHICRCCPRPLRNPLFPHRFFLQYFLFSIFIILCYFEMLSILFNAFMKGVLLCFRICMTSAVCGFIPSFIFITRTARSAREPPRFLRFVNAAWPGVSMKRKPGIFNLIPDFSIKGHYFFSCYLGKRVNDMFWVIPPASEVWTEVCLSLSNMLVFPWSTWPTTVTIGWRIFFEVMIIRGEERIKKFLEEENIKEKTFLWCEATFY